jgi:ferredoxin
MYNEVYLKGVSTLELDSNKCNGCGMCVEVCPHQVFNMVNKKAQIADKDKCMECGACSLNCARAAIKVKSGVGCAAAVINGFFNKSEPSCGCGTKETCCN